MLYKTNLISMQHQEMSLPLRDMQVQHKFNKTAFMIMDLLRYLKLEIDSNKIYDNTLE